MKYLNYVVRNAVRNPVRSLLTVASTAICLFLMMVLLAFLSISSDVAGSLRLYNRIITMSAQGFDRVVPIARVHEVAALDGVVAASPFSWYGGKFGEERLPFAQFGVDADTIFTIYDELTLPRDQLKAFQADKAGCVVGKKLAEDRGFRVGDRLPLKADLYPLDLTLTIRGIYDGPENRNLRMCMFHWEHLDEGLKRDFRARASGNAGVIAVKCKDATVMAGLSRKIDESYRNSDSPTRTMNEEAFNKMFADMYGDLKGMIRNIGLAVVFSLVCVAGNAMAMALRERTTEVAVLKAIGFGKSLLIALVLAEALLVTGLGGVVGALGSKLVCDVIDLGRYTASFLPFFYIPWSTAILGLGVSLLIGLASGFIPAVRAARLSVVQGLRKVV
jgi:putative ABC transport system permease protein